VTSARVSRVLVPTDFSRGATKALGWAVALKTAFHAELVVLHVVDFDALAYMNLSGERAYEPIPIELLERIRADAERAMARVTESFPGSQPMIREGSPRAIIPEVAKELNASLIVMGTHGRSGLARVAFGSVADYVIRHSPVPVLTVREPEGQ
jgi:nucleotide-binding universal stress UspA family protein